MKFTIVVTYTVDTNVAQMRECTGNDELTKDELDEAVREYIEENVPSEFCDLELEMTGVNVSPV